jgi:dihydropteroate synthase
MGAAVEAARSATDLPVSADTSRAGVARVALAAGATIVNDVTGMLGDPRMAGLVAHAGASCILMANETSGPVADLPPADAVIDLLTLSLAAARDAGIRDERIVLDPGIGFFRNRPIPWHQWDLELVRAVPRFSLHDRPILIGVSRKSFIGSLLGRPDPADRLAGSLIAAVHAARLGAAVIRTHDVAATRDALRMAELLDG